MPSTPLPLSGIVLAAVWMICANRKRHDVGGWLLFFYIQMYAGLAVTLLSVIGAFRLEAWFLASTLPVVATRLAEAAVATRMLRSRSWTLVLRLRRLLALDLLICIAVFAIDLWRQSPDAFLDALALLWPAIWLPYFVRSTRVWAVFQAHTWEATFQAPFRGFEIT